MASNMASNMIDFFGMQPHPNDKRAFPCFKISAFFRNDLTSSCIQQSKNTALSYGEDLHPLYVLLLAVHTHTQWNEAR